MTDYKPIDCGLHDQLELFVMRKKPITINWHEPGHERKVIELLPEDIFTKNHEEFLVARNTQGTTQTIRLDYITLID